MPNRKEIITAAESMIGVPFLDKGRTRRGVDCIGMLILMAEENGWLPDNFEDDLNYGAYPDRRQLLKGLTKHTRLSTRKPGNVALMPMLGWTHVGIITDRNLIHADSSAGKVVEHVLDVRWERRIMSYWEFKGMTLDE